MRRVLLSPHLDDVVLSCFGAVAPGGAVVTAFAGVPDREGVLSPWDARCGERSSREVMLRRQAEDRRAVAIAGGRPRHLPFLEEPYRESVAATAGLAEALRAEVEGADEVWVPAAVGGHPDHRLLRSLAFPLLAAAPPATVWLYAEYPYHQYLARDLRQAPAEALRGWLPGGAALHAHRLGTAALAAKREAVTCYRSQLAALDSTLERGRGLLDEEPLGTEYAWCLRGAASCCQTTPTHPPPRSEHR